MNYDGHGINRPDGTRILTWARQHADQGGDYVVQDEEAKVLGPLLAAAPVLAQTLQITAQRIAEFDRRCKRAERTDIDEMWNLLYVLRDDARAALRAAAKGQT